MMLVKRGALGVKYNFTGKWYYCSIGQNQHDRISPPHKL